MGTVRLVARRARARSGLLLSTGAIVAVAAYFVCIILGGLAAQTASDVRAALTSGDGRSLLMTVTPTKQESAAEASSAAAALIADLVPLAEVAGGAGEGGETTWVLTPGVSATSPAGAERLSTQVEALAAAVATGPVADARIELDGGLPGTLAELDRGLLAASAVTPVPVLLTVAFTAIALAQLARLLGAARLTETELLRARGSTRGQIAGLAAIESAAVALPGLLLGCLLASATLALRDGWHPESSSGWPAALVVAALAPVVFCLDAWRRSSRSSSGRRAEVSGRGTGATATAAVIAVIAASVAVIQLAQYGSPLVPAADGGVRVDLIAEAGPILVLVAGSLVALLAFRPLAGIVERVTARGTSLPAVLGSRQVARHVAMFQVALLLVSLAVASAVFTSGYAATWRALARASAEQANGADVRAVFSGDALDPAEVDDARGVKAVAAAAPVATAPIRIGSDTASLTALAPELMTNVMLDAGGTVDVAAIADDLASAPVGLELSPASTALRVSVAALAPESDRRGVVMVSAWISDRDGALVSLPLGTAAVGAGEQSDLAAPLPEDGGPWRLLAVDGALSGADGATGIGITVLSWGTDADDSATLPVPPSASAPLSSREALSRVMATEASATTVPAVITSALAARLGLGVGDRFDYQFDGLLRSGSAEVRGTAPSVPGSTNPLGVILPLGALDDALLRENDSPAPADEIWAAATTDADLDSVADDVSTALDGAATISTATPGPATRLAEPGVAAAWAGVAAAIALAVIAIVAITVTLLAGRSAEAGLLRALGVSARAQSGGRSVELAVVAAAGLVMGVGIGAVAVLCAAVPFARGSVAEAAGTIVLPPVVDAATLGVAIAVLLAAVAGVIAVYAVRVRDQAAHAIIAGDAA